MRPIDDEEDALGAADRQLIAQQIAYYRARASEYDEWFLRQGRYDRGEEHRRQWLEELREVETALAELAPLGKVLELAAGTGQWTGKLAALASEGLAGEVLAVDASPEVLERNRIQVGSPKVRYLEADLFAWQPSETFDLVFMGFWLSHVPPARFDGFWSTVRAALVPGGKVFIVDSAYHPESTARDHQLSDQGVVERKLNDGRSFEIVKVFYQPEELQARLAGLGFEGWVRGTRDFFIYGCCEPTPHR